MVIFELATLTVKREEGSVEKIADAFSSMKNSKGMGFKGAAFGPVLEEEGKFRALVGWESVDAHAAFGNSEQARPVMEGLADTVEEYSSFHVDFDMNPFAAGGACTKRIVEMVHSTFPANAVPPQAEGLFKESGEAMNTE